MADGHQFGGAWTEQKLDALAGYLTSYTTALQSQPFRLAYIDAFAGTGYRISRSTPDEHPALFADAREYQAGSVRIALETQSGFDRFIFIDNSPDHIRQLEELSRQFRNREIQRIAGEANREIRQLCSTINWGDWRAVLFLDPYGMQVEWPTLESIAQTRAIDLWLLVPMGIAINRMLPNSGDIPESWQRRLDIFFGTTEWRGAAYNSFPSHQPDLPGLLTEGDALDNIQRASLEHIERYFIHRLHDIFPAVLESPLRLYNSRRTWLYSLFFAVANTNSRAQAIALRIAAHIVSRPRGA